MYVCVYLYYIYIYIHIQKQIRVRAHMYIHIYIYMLYTEPMCEMYVRICVFMTAPRSIHASVAFSYFF